MLNITGNYTQASTGTLAIEVNPTTASKLAVGGTASLAGNLKLVYDPGTYNSSTVYTILSSTGLSGTFSGVTGSGNGVTGQTIEYSPPGYANDVVLTGVTQTVGTPTGVFTGVTNSILGNAFGGSGEVFTYLNNYASGEGTNNVETALAMAQPMQVAFSGNIGQLAQAGTHIPDTIAKYGGWVRAIGNFLSVHGQGSNPAYGENAGGFIAGIDRNVSRNLILGVAGGYSHSFISQTGGGGGDIDTPRILGYASYNPAPRVHIDAVAGFAYDRITTTRPVAALGTNATESHNGFEESLAAQVGYDMPTGDWTLVPRAGFQYLHLDQTSYNEIGRFGFRPLLARHPHQQPSAGGEHLRLQALLYR